MKKLFQFSEKPETDIPFSALKQEFEDKENLLNQVEEKEKVDDIPVFPIGIFPESIQNIIKEASRTLNFSIDFLSVSILYAASVAIGNTHKLRIKNGWVENALLYLIIVGKKGINKSHPLSFAIQPILDRDRKLYVEYRKEFAAYQAAIDTEGVDKSTLEKPVLNKTLVSDFTIEALIDTLDRNERGLGVYVDEISGWFKNFERYHKGNEQEFWLSVFSGKSIISDRKTSKSINISQPFVSVIGSIQPELLYEIGKNSRNYNGFTDRLLFCFPDNLIKSAWNDNEISEQTLEDYRNIIESLFHFDFEIDEVGDAKSKILEFSAEAKTLIYDWQNQTNLRLYNDPNHVVFSGAYSKFESYIGRFCFILQLLNNVCAECASRSVIEIEAAEGAIALVEYFRKNAIKVLSIISSYNALDFLTPDKLTVYQALPDEFQRDMSLSMAMTLGMKRATFDRFLKDNVYFKKVKTGTYFKLY